MLFYIKTNIFLNYQASNALCTYVHLYKVNMYYAAYVHYTPKILVHNFVARVIYLYTQ